MPVDGPLKKRTAVRTRRYVQDHRYAGLTGSTPPPTPQKGVPRCRGGGDGGQNPKNHWGVIFGPKMMNLQGV